MSRTTYYTATSLDGFIADEDDSLDWLLLQDHDEDGPMSYGEFIEGMGALVMGATTYEWVLANHVDKGEDWPYQIPSWVASHRKHPGVQGADIRFAQGDVVPLHAEMVAAAGGKDLWVVGGGDLAGQFADAGLLDEIVCSVAPVTLGAGRPILPRRLDLKLVELAQNRVFANLRFEVLRPRE